MSFISEVKCGKCDRMYSGLRSKCHYCGTRRISAGKYAPNNENQSGKILIAILILSVFVVASGVLLFTTEPEYVPEPVVIDPEPDDYLNGLLSLDSEDIVLPPTDNNDETTPDDLYDGPIIPRSINVRSPWGGIRNNEFSMSMSDAPLKLTARVEPLGVTETVEWVSSNDDVFSVVPGNIEGTEATVRPIGTGTARLTVSVGDLEVVITVRINR